MNHRKPNTEPQCKAMVTWNFDWAYLKLPAVALDTELAEGALKRIPDAERCSDRDQIPEYQVRSEFDWNRLRQAWG